jgi:hypothetical protein
MRTLVQGTAAGGFAALEFAGRRIEVQAFAASDRRLEPREVRGL